MKTYNYFVSFAHSNGFGNCVINCSEPITDFKSITSIEKLLMARDIRADKVTVLNFQLLSVEGDEEVQNYK